MECLFKLLQNPEGKKYVSNSKIQRVKKWDSKFNILQKKHKNIKINIESLRKMKIINLD